VSNLSLSRKSLVGRLMLAFCLLGFLLLLLVSLGSLSLYWVKLADKYLYDEALPASQAARSLVQSSNALSENATALARAEEEPQRQFIGRILSINSANMLGAIASLKVLEVQSARHLELSAGEIIHDMSQLGIQVGKRLTVARRLSTQGEALAKAASHSTDLLEAELAVVDSAILAKLSLAYPEVAGNAKSAYLLDSIIEQDLDIQERLNRALKLINNIALVGQLLQSPEQEIGLLKVLSGMSQTPVLSRSFSYQIKPSPQSVAFPNSSPLFNLGPKVDLMALELLKGLIRDPARALELDKELVELRQVSQGLAAQKRYSELLKEQDKQLQALSDKLYGLNEAVDNAMATQQQQAELARIDYLQQLSWAKAGLWSTGVLMFLVILFVIYKVIYKGIALRLNEATEALSRLSLGDTEVTINSHGDDELTAMANALKAFKQKTTHNQKLQAELRDSAAELIEHKAALEITVEARTQELAIANKQLDAEAKGHAQARTMAELANQAKSLFLATMSHEIRTPLNGLLGTLTLLSHSELPRAQKQMLALSQYSGTLLQTVLNDILDFSRLEQGKLTNEPRPVAINDLLDEVVAIMLAGAGLAGLRLVLDSAQLPTCISVDGPKLRQVLFNLLGNAIKFTPEGEVRLKVYIEGERLCFEVLDTGVGICADAKTQLFKAYGLQPNQGRSRGTGLGLAISKELVALMCDASEADERLVDHEGGERTKASDRLWVESEVNKGSRFGFNLPLHVCKQAISTRDQPLNQVSKKSVLVIEDNKVNAMVAQGFLAHLGHESTLANSCNEARELYRLDTAKHFDAIMLDIQLGDGSGFELLEELKVINERVSHPLDIAAFTAQIQADDIASYHTAGFDIVLGKPLNMQSLAAWIGVARADASPELISPASISTEPASSSKSCSGLNERCGSTNVDKAESLIDLNQIQQDIDYLGLDAVTEMLALYRESSQVQVHALGEYPKHTGTLLHALKGSSASMGLIAMADLCKVLEGEAYQVSEHQQLLRLYRESINALETLLTP